MLRLRDCAAAVRLCCGLRDCGAATGLWLRYPALPLPGRGYDPQKVQQAQELLKTHEGLVAVVVLVMFVMLLVIVAGGCIGGAL
jgi:cytochrome b